MASINNYNTSSQKVPTGETGKLVQFSRAGTTATGHEMNREQAGNDSFAIEKNEYQGREGDVVDNNQILEKYIDKVDRDQAALREDIRESERRTSERVAVIEERMDARLNRIEDMLQKNSDSYNADYKSLITQINSSGNENRKFMWGIAITILVACVATVVAVIVGA